MMANAAQQSQGSPEKRVVKVFKDLKSLRTDYTITEISVQCPMRCGKRVVVLLFADERPQAVVVEVGTKPLI